MSNGARAGSGKPGAALLDGVLALVGLDDDEQAATAAEAVMPVKKARRDSCATHEPYAPALDQSVSILLPSAPSTYQMPPSPCPLASPGFESPLNV